MRTSLILAFSLLTTPFMVNEGIAHQVGNNPLRRAERLDPAGKYLLEWEVDWNTKRIIFNVTAETKNWIEFGIADNEKPSTVTDVVIGGVDSKGKSYFTDRHKVRGDNNAILDKTQDWTLHSAWENGSHTSLNFSRFIDTCDPEDYPIQLSRVVILWAFGNGDEEKEISPESRGIFHAFLLDPDYAHIPKDTKVWTFEKSRQIPSNHTSYICSIHKGPSLKKKHHIIGAAVHIPQEINHHFILWRCHAPSGHTAEEVFEPHLSNYGEPCYIWKNRLPDGVHRKIPMQLCSEIYIAFTMGAKNVFLPNHLGFPFGNSEHEHEYFMLEAHYDNVKEEAIQVDLRIDFFYQNQLRPNDAGVMVLPGEIPGKPEYLLIPPNSKNHRVSSHCCPECTQTMFPPSGITIVAAFLHTHNNGAKMRLQHFRGDRELPWIVWDDNYNNRAQTIRYVREERRVMPGDQLVNDCYYNTDKAGVVGGFAGSQEMCLVFMIYYTKIEGYSYCSSGIHSSADRQRFLMFRDAIWSQDELEWIIQTPANLSGLKLSHVNNELVDWTPEKRKELRHFHETQTHFGHCRKDYYTRYNKDMSGSKLADILVGILSPDHSDNITFPVSYPSVATPYSPPSCSA